MTFESAVRGREVSYITRILDVFGVVGQQQMRALFSHLDDEAYGKILTRLNREGLIYWAKDGIRLAASRLTMDRTSFRDSMMCFWVFVQMKDSVRDFCAGGPPALATVATRNRMIDLIPVSADSLEEVNAGMESVPGETRRFLVTGDLRAAAGLTRRGRNDFVLHVGEDGKTEIYEL